MKILKSLVLMGLIGVPCYYFALILNLLNTADLSIADVYQRPAAEKEHSVHFVTYAQGSEVFHKNRNIEVYSAINRGVDFIYLYRKENIDADFLQANPILEEKLGAGFWLWKPYFILKTLEQIPEGDVLLYADSGVLIKHPLTEFISDMLKTKYIALFDYHRPEYGTASRIANGDTFAAVDCQTEACFKSPHVWAGLILLRNSPKSRDFVQKWLSLCQNTALLSGQPSKVSNQSNFSHQQHDEGILCALVAKHSKDVYFQPMDTDFYQHFFIHRRKIDDKSLLGYVFARGRKHQQSIVNNWFIRTYAQLTSFLIGPMKNNYNDKSS